MQLISRRIFRFLIRISYCEFLEIKSEQTSCISKIELMKDVSTIKKAHRHFDLCALSFQLSNRRPAGANRTYSAPSASMRLPPVK
ncbi:MAG TPA: hypothetical protein DIW81_03580, partial [Planctomycetaceae bacterium]|nr:hypothetical protein [Planctomycetaceae bacterium]